MLQPIGFSMGSELESMKMIHAMLESVGGDDRRVVPVHEPKVAEIYPTRVIEPVLSVTELVLRDGETSRVA